MNKKNDKIAKITAKIEKLKSELNILENEREKLAEKKTIINSNSNIPESILTIIGTICKRNGTEMLVLFDSNEDAFCAYDCVKEIDGFTLEGIFYSDRDYDYNFPLAPEERKIDYRYHFAVKVYIEDDMIKYDSVDIERESGKILI